MVLVGYGDLQIPLYWELLNNKSGNSNAKDRIDLLTWCLQLIGKERIGLVIGDREFVGHEWFKYLKDNGINFVMRLPKHHLIRTQAGKQYAISDLDFKNDEPIIFFDCQVDGIWGHAWIKTLNEGEFLFLFGNVTVKFMGQFYRKRWTIEKCFQNLKGRGFNLEMTHLTCLNKLKKLVALVSLAYSFCVTLGIYFHRKVQSIKIKNHGYKVASFSRHGLNHIREMSREQALVKADSQLKVKGLCRWLRRQLSHYQYSKIVG